ncbi:ubiquitin-protein transferase activating protein [Mactra antiquata]
MAGRERHTKPFDRFIPFRPNLNVESSHARLMSGSTYHSKQEVNQHRSPGKKARSRLLSEATNLCEGSILPLSAPRQTSPFRCRNTYQLFPVSPDEGYSSPSVSRHRNISTKPETIMDMPGLRDDFYTNLLDWSNRNQIAVVLDDQTTYVWNTDSKDCVRIDLHVPMADFYICSICWSKRENLLAMADSEGEITLCDVIKKNTERKITPFKDSSRIGAIQWTDMGIISGNGRGKINLHDTRCKDGVTINKLVHGHHGREVCGLKPVDSTYTSYLASGGDDGTLNVWDLRMMKTTQSIKAHTACVKALSWCPWRPGMIASGGGAEDGHIKLWLAHSGEKLGEISTNSQVCGLLWSDEYRELVSAHGSATPDKNFLTVWNVQNNQFESVARLKEHRARPLHMTMSPDKTTIASAGADEAMCLWNTFPRKSNKRVWSSWDRSMLNLTRYVR